jgi:hypothetical protein
MKSMKKYRRVSMFVETTFHTNLSWQQLQRRVADAVADIPTVRDASFVSAGVGALTVTDATAVDKILRASARKRFA